MSSVLLKTLLRARTAIVLCVLKSYPRINVVKTVEAIRTLARDVANGCRFCAENVIQLVSVE